MSRKFYVLTAKADSDLREARAWSRARWGKELTNQYFEDLHQGAQFIADNQSSLPGRHDLAGGTTLLLYPLREHYIVYEPLGKSAIAIVALIRQGRDLPSILQKWAAPIRRELQEVRAMVTRGDIVFPRRRSLSVKRKASKKK